MMMILYNYFCCS